jgi:PTS system nitrogen regulatory IIA component
MINDINLCSLIHRGGVYFNVRGSTPEAVYRVVSESLQLPKELSADTLYNELCQREELMSTAVGNGIAIPHPRYPLLKNPDDERLVVCFPDKPVSMNAPDPRPVYAMFFLLTASSQSHLKVLSQLAYLFQKAEFRFGLEKKPLEPDLLALVKKNIK